MITEMFDELHECGVEATHSNTPVRREDTSGRLLHFYIWSGNRWHFLCRGTNLSSSRCSPSSRRHDRSSYGILPFLDEFCTAQHLHRKLNVNGRIRLSQTHRRIKLFANNIFTPCNKDCTTWATHHGTCACMSWSGPYNNSCLYYTAPHCSSLSSKHGLFCTFAHRRTVRP